MRLDASEVAGIIKGVDTFVGPGANGVQLYLFGSRCDDTKRGGDIDLLILGRAPADIQKLRAMKTKISEAIQDAIGEQRIDITIKDRSTVGDDPFLQSILKYAVLLKAWPS
ncbi:MAG: nucleotidyltransferase domain-containing protein [Myxococcota bacterium]